MEAMQVTAHGAPLERAVLPTPVPTGREVLVRVEACGVCHTDLHLWDGFYDLGAAGRLEMATRGVRPPMTLGHEIFGTVSALGPEATGAAVGDRRAVYPWIGCGTCAVCAAGDGHLCLQARSLGVFRPGGYADHVLVPDADYLVDVTGISDGLAPTLACSGVTVFSALRKLGAPVAGVRPVLIGAGGLGLTAVQLAKAVGFDAPVVVDIDARKLDAARAMAQVSTVDATAADAVAQIRDLTGGGAAAAIDFVGSDRSSQLGIDVLRRGGTLVSVGLFGGSVTVPVPLLALRAIALVGSYVGSLQEFRDLVALVKSGAVAPIPVSTRPLSAATEALNDLRAGRITGRVLLRP
jgi:alcohol dehydrogenase/propanol-preferring alcohol dehydrogenase